MQFPNFVYFRLNRPEHCNKIAQFYFDNFGRSQLSYFAGIFFV